MVTPFCSNFSSILELGSKKAVVGYWCQARNGSSDGQVVILGQENGGDNSIETPMCIKWSEDSTSQNQVIGKAACDECTSSQGTFLNNLTRLLVIEAGQLENEM